MSDWQVYVRCCLCGKSFTTPEATFEEGLAYICKPCSEANDAIEQLEDIRSFCCDCHEPLSDDLKGNSNPTACHDCAAVSASLAYREIDRTNKEVLGVCSVCLQQGLSIDDHNGYLLDHDAYGKRCAGSGHSPEATYLFKELLVELAATSRFDPSLVEIVLAK